MTIKLISPKTNTKIKKMKKEEIIKMKNMKNNLKKKVKIKIKKKEGKEKEL